MRKELFIILSRKNGSLATVIFSWVLTLMVLANVMAVILESIPSLHEQYRWEFHAFELFSVVFFLVEYLCRIWVAVALTSSSQRASGRSGCNRLIS